MTRVFNQVSAFADDVLTGLAAAYPEHVQRVFGGVVRATDSPEGEVAVVIGGGSGHYPAFSGWVGPGMAHAAVQGNVFASPSASQVYAVCRAAEKGGGVLLSYGNYAGDVLHFGQAAAKLRAEGLDVRVLPVTDDIASGPVDARQLRRGVAGDLVVFKVAGAAAERGWDLDRVEEVARRANDSTRSLGVAFDGCTMPGASEPLFTVPDGEMSIGLGVHGEPGVREVPMGSATEIARLLAEGVLAEQPERAEGGYAGRAAVLLNGLGTVQHEELLIVFGEVARLFAEAGVAIVQPEVGELMTSLDMAGLSLTVCYLDAELEELWATPVDTPALRRGAVTGRAPRARIGAEAPAAPPIERGSEASRGTAAAVRQVLRLMNTTALDAEPELGRMDAIAGDGDHGQGMSLGSTGAAKAADAAWEAGAGAKTLMIRAGEQWAESAGGTSGALWGSGLTGFAGAALSDERAATDADIVAGMVAFVDTILQLGGAKPGDKTMVDALVPFAETLRAEFDRGEALSDAWVDAARASTAAAAATAALVARRGRSRVLGDKSLGTPDPGATSFALLMTVVGASGLLVCRGDDADDGSDI